VAVRDVIVRPDILLRALTAHAIAEAMLNAPQFFGSLQLLLNPTGLVQSVQRGLADMINLPLEGWNQRSATRFFAGIGRGSASLFTGVSGTKCSLFVCKLLVFIFHNMFVLLRAGWTFTSITGFSQAAIRALDSSGEVGRVIGAPFSGALSLVGSITASIAAGLMPLATPRRHGRIIAAPPEDHLCAFAGGRLLAHPGLCLAPGLVAGRYLGHWAAQNVIIYQGAAGLGIVNASLPSFSLSHPVMLLTSAAIILYSDDGLTPVLVMPLAGTEHALKSFLQQIEFFALAASPADNPPALSSALVVAQFQLHVWLDILPVLRFVV